MKRLIQFFIFSFFLGIVSFNSSAQIPTLNVLNNRFELFTGPLYYFPNAAIIGSPFLDTSRYNATIFYNGRTYKEIETFFDIASNDFAVKNENGNWVVIESERIDSIQVGEYKFKHFKGLNKLSAKGKRKLFEVYETSKSTLIIEHDKNLVERIVNNTLEREYLYEPKYFIKTNEKISSITSAKGLIKLFPDKAKELRMFYKENDKFKNLSKGAAMKALLQYYSRL